MSAKIAVASLAAAGLFLGLATGAGAQPKPAGVCVSKAGQGTNTSEDGAKFQAWEAVLQATDWGSWMQFMAQGMKVGTAPGYKVSKVRFKCNKGGLGSECVAQATLCK